MKKIISALLAVMLLASAAALTAVQAEAFANKWEFDKDIEKFQANKSTLSFKDGSLVQTVVAEKDNTWLLSPNNLSIDTAKYKYLKIGVKNNTDAKSQFAIEATGTAKEKFAGKWCDLGSIPNDGQYHEYVVDLSKIADWQGTVNRFRLRVTAWKSAGTVEVAYIRLSDTGETAAKTEAAKPTTPASPATLDAGIVMAITAAVSAAGAVVIRRKY
ncbi:MAG: hypothetical protein E7662_09970 [Ruminococcaceae bacterium]|nr:hypothetical protein [Oscillospiraceae bacterium]